MARNRFNKRYSYFRNFLKKPYILSAPKIKTLRGRKRPLSDPWYIPPFKKLIGPSAFTYAAIGIVPTVVSHFSYRAHRLQQVPQYLQNLEFGFDQLAHRYGHGEL